MKFDLILVLTLCSTSSDINQLMKCSEFVGEMAKLNLIIEGQKAELVERDAKILACKKLILKLKNESRAIRRVFMGTN